MRLIDADALSKLIKTIYRPYWHNSTVEQFIDLITNAPTMGGW